MLNTLMSPVSEPGDGWIVVADDCDVPAFSGGNMERPDLRWLLNDIEDDMIKAPLEQGHVRNFLHRVYPIVSPVSGSGHESMRRLLVGVL